MIQFRQKSFSEYDAMRSLYVELMKDPRNRSLYKIANSKSLIPLLKGNNVIIERFVISTSLFGKSKYRMYLKIGARAKMPDDVRLPERYISEKFGHAQLTIGNIGGGDNNGGNNDNDNKGKEKKYSNIEISSSSSLRMKLFKGNGNGYPFPKIDLPIDLSHQVKILLGEAIKYDKKERSLVLEFNSIDDAIRALNILPFGINYTVYLLDV